MKVEVHETDVYSDWVHDRFDEDDNRGPRRGGGRGGSFGQYRGRRSPDSNAYVMHIGQISLQS